jgi:hypothetical protein
VVGFLETFLQAAMNVDSGDSGDSGDRVRDSSWNSHGLTWNSIYGLDKPRMDS